MNCVRPTRIGALGIGTFIVLSATVWAQDLAPSVTPTPAPVVPVVSPVIWTENPDVVQRFAVNPEAVRAMVNGALLKLTSASDIGTAWQRLGITPQDIVGIKITTTGGPLLSTHHPIVQAICDGLQAAGLTPSHIIIWDKDGDDMRRAGYAPAFTESGHPGISDIFPDTGYDPKVIYKNEQIGTLIWGDSEFVRHDAVDDLTRAISDAIKKKAYDDGTSGGITGNRDGSLQISGSTIPQTSNRSYYARLVTQLCTKIINVPVLTDNPNTGIDGCLASLALACVDNNRRFQGDPTFGDPALCEILDKDFMRRKVVVHILDALVSQYAGGPQFDPQFTKSIGALYVSRDPVAIDSLVLPRIEQWRASDRQGRIDPIGKHASHIHSAAATYNLGTDDPHRIQLIRL